MFENNPKGKGKSSIAVLERTQEGPHQCKFLPHKRITNGFSCRAEAVVRICPVCKKAEDSNLQSFVSAIIALQKSLQKELLVLIPS